MEVPNYRHTHQLRFILCGASGAGKSTMAHILEQELGLRRCITTTTRPPRSDEADGKDYYFTDLINPDKMFECASFGGYEYGISLDELQKGDFVILEPQGVEYYRQHYPENLTVIQLQRSGIQVDLERCERDRTAGFDDIHPDILITGETVEDMSQQLLTAVREIIEHDRINSLDDLLQIARSKNTQGKEQTSNPEKGGLSHAILV